MCAKRILFGFVLLAGLLAGPLRAQTYPSALITTFTGPRTLFLDEYADPFKPRIRTSIFFTDFSQSSWNFRLRLKITGPNGLVIQTKTNLVPNPILVMPGQPMVLEGADLAWYFDFNHLDFTGINRAQFEQSKRLPEGNYAFCFEALDYETGKALSLPACANGYLALNDPAIITAPICTSVIENIAFQNIYFQWQVSNITGNLDFSQLNYRIHLYEVNTNWSNPNNAIVNNQALLIWTSDLLNQNSFLYGLTEPPLSRGKRYVCTVTTTHAGGRDSFKNNGVSSPCYFHYGYFENDTLEVIKPEDEFQFALSTPSQFKWKKPKHALSTQLIKYTLRLVEIGTNQSPQGAMLSNTPFFQQEYLPVNDAVIDKTIPVVFWMNVKRMGHYAWQVFATSGTQEVAKSPLLVFTGPPAIETFIAGGFLMKITKLSAYDTIHKIISGRCTTTLNPAWGRSSEFAFQQIGLTAIGNNEWVMSSGSIADAITPGEFTLQPQTHADNKQAWFKADSVYIDLSALKLAGIIHWNLPHPTSSGLLEQISSERTKLNLANGSFYLASTQIARLNKNYQLELLDPLGFILKIDRASSLVVYQSKYEFSFQGFLQLGSKVTSAAKTPVNMAFKQAQQLFYFSETDNENSEALQVAKGTDIELQARTYTIDLSERISPPEFQNDSMWKGVCFGKSILQFPTAVETTKQLSLPVARTWTLNNTNADTIVAHVNAQGLFFKASFPFVQSDTLRFNTFPSKSGFFYAKIKASEIEKAFIRGGMIIPLLDTVQSFPYNIELTDFGFQEGYLVNGLAGHSFTFNALGGAEQRVAFSIQRAIFKGRNKLDLDVNLSWPYFDLNIQQVQNLSVWGNGNIGFDVPNGKSSLTYQSKGKASNFEITVDYLGCGRNGNAYAFGASAGINMDEEISGENGPPVINAYSICRNPLLRGTVTTSPPASTVASSSTSVSQNYQSSTASYTNVLQTANADVLQSLGYTPTDSLSLGGLFNPDESHIDPLIKGATVMQIKDLIDLVLRLKPYIQTKAITNKDWMLLDRFKKVIDSDIINQAQLTNGRDLINYVLNKAVESMVIQLEGEIQSLSDKAMYKVRVAINNKITGPIDAKIDKAITSIFDRLKQRLLSSMDEQYHAAITAAIASVRGNLISEIKNSVNLSFENNVTSKLGNVVQLGITAKVKNYVKLEVSTAAQKLIQDGVNANIKLDLMLKNGGAVLVNITDTLRDVLMNINGKTFVNTAESLVDDAIAGIDWNNIANNILNDLVKKGLAQGIASQVSQLIGQNAGPYVSAILNSVKFDFSNLGDKLKNGEFDKIVKFDVTNIYLQTPAIDVRGALNFKKDDPVFGDNWQADVLVRVKIPKKDNPVECSAFFLNGKTKTLAQNYTYWYAKLAVSGFNVPLSPAPVIWDGVDGFAFSKMKKEGSSVTPDNTNKFGVGAKFSFYDQQSSGKSFIFDLGADATFNDGGFAVQLLGNASVFNFNKQGSKFVSPGFITGTGTLGYYKTPELSKIAGNFNVTFHTSPLLCAGGEVGLDLRTPNNWKVWVGTQQTPIGVKILCKDFLSNTAFFELSQSGFKTGLNMNVNLAARSPWIETSVIKIRGYTQFQLGYSAFTSVEWDPSFKINEASLSAWLVANIGIDYQTAASSSSMTLAGVALSGSLTYKSQPESELHGEMAGAVTVLGYQIDFKTPVNYSLSKQEIME